MRVRARLKKAHTIRAGRRLLWMALPTLTALLLLAGVLLRLFGGPVDGATSGIGGPFRLVSGDGSLVTEQDFHGKYLLVYFGYTHCPDVCPTTLNDIAHALTLLGPRAAHLQTLFITVDPKRDIPPLIEKYVAQFSPSIIGLTGSVAAIDAVEKQYRVDRDMVTSSDKEHSYTIDHTAVLYLMGPDGHFITALRASEGGAEMAATLAKFLP